MEANTHVTQPRSGDDEGIDYSDIPPIRDFSRFVRGNEARQQAREEWLRSRKGRNSSAETPPK